MKRQQRLWLSLGFLLLLKDCLNVQGWGDPLAWVSGTVAAWRRVDDSLVHLSLRTLALLSSLDMLVSTSACVWLWRFGPSVSPCSGFLTYRTFFLPPSCYKAKGINLLCKIDNNTTIELVSFCVVATVWKVPDQSPWPAGRHVCFVWQSSLFASSPRGTQTIHTSGFYARSIYSSVGFANSFSSLTLTCHISAVKVQSFLKCFCSLWGLNVKNWYFKTCVLLWLLTIYFPHISISDVVCAFELLEFF